MNADVAPPIPGPGPAHPRIDRLLFDPIDARVAAVFRVLLAAMVVWAFESSGLEPSRSMLRRVDVGWAYDAVFLTGWYYAVIVSGGVLFAAGWKPRASGLLLLAMVLPLALLTRGQQSRHVLCFVLLAFTLVRSDAAWSVRSWLASRRGSREEPTTAGPIGPIRLIQLQLSLLYLVNALVKMHPAYLTGDALMAMSRMRPNFNIDMTDGIVEMGPIAMPVMLAAVGTVVTELFLAFGFWVPRLRWVTAIVGVGFHVCLMIVVDIWMLDWVSMFLYSAFLLPWCAGDAVQSSR